MASEFLIPHPNIPTAEVGLPKLKEITVKNNENFLALDLLCRQFKDEFLKLDKKIDAEKHDHPYAPLEHTHQLTEVEGLIAALENKAPLVHTHPEYLTEVPEHNHTIYNVNGLVEALAEKANVQHVHNMNDVNGLLDALAGKASTEQVNWLEENMARLTDSETPSRDTYEGGVGTSSEAARADHYHPLNKTDSASNLQKDGGSNGEPLIGELQSYALTDHAHPLNVTATDPSDAVFSDGTASAGSSNSYARADHVHKMPKLTADKVEFTPSKSVYEALETVVENLEDVQNWREDTIDPWKTDVDNWADEVVDPTLESHGTRITALENRPIGGGTVKSVDNVGPDGNGNVALGALTTSNYSTTLGSVYQAKSQKLSALDSTLTNDGKVLTSQIKGNVDGHTGDCYLTINNAGEVGHSGNAAFGLLNDASYSSGHTKRTGVEKLITNIDIGNGLEADEVTHNLKVKVKSGGGIVSDNDGLSIGNLGFVQDNIVVGDANGSLSDSGISINDVAIIDPEDPFVQASQLEGYASQDDLDAVTVIANAASTAAEAAQTAADEAQATADSKITETEANGLIDDAITALDLDNTYAQKTHEHSVDNITDLDSIYKAPFDDQHTKTWGIVGTDGTSLGARDSIGSDMVLISQNETLDSVIGLDGVVDGSRVAVGTDSGKFVKTGTGGVLEASSDAVASFANAPTGGKWVKTSGTNGELVESSDIPITTSETNFPIVEFQDGVGPYGDSVGMRCRNVMINAQTGELTLGAWGAWHYAFAG